MQKHQFLNHLKMLKSSKKLKKRNKKIVIKINKIIKYKKIALLLANLII